MISLKVIAGAVVVAAGYYLFNFFKDCVFIFFTAYKWCIETPVDLFFDSFKNKKSVKR